MLIDRRAAIVSIGAFGFAGLASRGARAASYPARQITLVVPFTAGGNADAAARIVGAKLQEIAGRTVIVVNRPGAGGIIGADFVNRANPDGYTLLAGSNGPLSAGPVFRKTPYDTQKDFMPIGTISWTPEVLLASKQFAPKALADIIAYGKTKPLRAGTQGIESAPGTAMALFRLRAGVQLTEVVYNGASEQYPPLMGGELDIGMDQVSAAAPMSKGDAVRMVAIADDKRSPVAPDVPTFKEAGMEEIVAGAYIGLVAPAKAPPDVVAYLQQSFAKIMASEDVRSHLTRIGSVVPEDVWPAGLLQMIAKDTERAKSVDAAMKAKTG